MKPTTYPLCLWYAVRYIASRPLRANPQRLLLETTCWWFVQRPVTEQECEYCGESAARNVAMPINNLETK